ncbi:uncharacterized protein LOC110618338 isoform X2 [Manihot esculenta]|nr:uncharacterized protein LOC110618338 isoform X2 [Manihot esculenta]OAY46888.2 hypothetical protein MANES_06G035400v8 [Manihot esculenta]
MRNQTLLREIEKERIRQEIIAEEIARRRVLEAEVRRELMMERELPMRLGIGDGGSSFDGRLTMRLEPGPWFPFPSRFYDRWVEERSAFHGRGVVDQGLQRPRLSEALVSPDVKSASKDDENKLIVLAKPNPNLCGAKRKAETPPEGGSGGLPDADLKKIPKEEWSCALCQVSATSERGLNEHLHGKRHKARLARLRADKMVKNSSPVQLPKKTTTGAELEVKAEGPLLQVEKGNNNTNKQTGDKQDSGNANDELQLQKNVHESTLKERNVAAEERTAEFRKKKKFRFWCEVCQVGAYSATVMENHKKGKKHRFRQQELNQNREAVPTIIKTVSSKPGEKAKDKEAETEKANGKITENANYNEKTTETVAGNEKIIGNVVAKAEGFDQSSIAS